MHTIVTAGIILAISYSGLACKCSPPKEGQEVCGSDGQTYGNDCLLFCASIAPNRVDCLKKVSNGTCCSSSCTCFDPCNDVCGSDGQTYGNECLLKCAQLQNPQLTKVCDGKCSE